MQENSRIQKRGFALVVSLMLMILLTVIAVGLLTLSAVSLRTSSSSLTINTAQANARLALMMALGELQKITGPDTRVTAPANLVNAALPAGLTGVWESWMADPLNISEKDYKDRKSGDHFLGYLASNPQPSRFPDPNEMPTGDEIETLIGTGTLGSGAKGKQVDVPVIRVNKDHPSALDGGIAWLVTEEGTKARIDLAPADPPSSLGGQIARVGSPARNRFPHVTALGFIENANESELEKLVPKLVDFKQAELKSSDRDKLGEYFHDFTTCSESLQVNVASGGLKTDLSVLFDGSYGTTLPQDYNNRYLYSDTSSPFPNSSSNSDTRWSLYANYARLYQLDSPSLGNSLSGVKAALPKRYQTRTIRDGGVTRTEPRMSLVTEPLLLPTVIRVDMVLSLVLRKAHEGRGTPQYPYQLHMMYLPVITLHNPFNMPLRCSDLQIEFADVPLGFQFLVNGQSATTGDLVPLNRLYTGQPAKKTFAVTLSKDLNNATEVVMQPGETTIFGTPFSPDATWASELATNGRVMFDWANNMTSNVKMIPGMITGPNDGIGFDIDWLAPAPRATWATARRNEGVLMIKADDQLQVRYGPIEPSGANGTFSITVRLANQEVGKTQVFYKNQTTLTPLLAEGTSPRFPTERSFPATFPEPGSPPLFATRMLESDNRKFSDYTNARPFAIFSVGAKTTVESFTKARPVSDTGIAYQMASCDFSNSSSQGSSPLEFALVPVKNGSAAIEADGDKGFFFGGHGATNGSTSATFYEIPLAPLQSIAQLRHANGASIGGPLLWTYSVGESRSHPAIPPDATHQASSPSKVLLDHSWLANNRLWDGYWFSSLSTLEGPAYSGSEAMSQKELAKRFFAGERDLPNPRNTPYFPRGTAANPEEAAIAALDDNGLVSATRILTKGGFNVNSTSVPAWTAVLSSLAQSEIPLVDGTLETSSDTPFPRFRRPPLGKASGAGSPKDELWNSYRQLKEDEIKSLAELIVEQVKLRGPFLSMAEFVNRRIGAPDQLTLSGAIQAALDQSTFNQAMNANSRPVSPAEVVNYGWLNPNAVTQSTGTGAPGDLTQGDVLSAIGSFLTVRSDTFRIRAYGDARDAKGNILAKAWCEATVQRVPDHVNPVDAPEAQALDDENVLFGRQFRIVAFRWLSQNEI